MNAVDALMQTLAPVMRQANGRLPDALRFGALPLTGLVAKSLPFLPEPVAYLEEQGTHPANPNVARDMYELLWAEPSFEINGIAAGQPALRHMAIPCEAQAAISVRLAPGQQVSVIQDAVERMLHEATPPGAELTITRRGASDPAALPQTGPLLDSAQDAFTAAFGTPALLIQAGGSLPLLTLLGDLGIVTVMTGFDLPEGNIHAPNERLLLEHLPKGTAILESILADRRFIR
jgi:acetylornithine deacetylase/succinyl-diaminopimelate desuccinylase-like protein